MIVLHSGYVPYALRAERLGFATSWDGRDSHPRRSTLRAVFCPRCGTHRTLVVELARWEPTGGVPHITCGSCAAASLKTLTLRDERPLEQRPRCPVCDHVSERPVLESGCDACGAFKDGAS